MKRILIIFLLFLCGLCVSAFAARVIAGAFGNQDGDCLLCQAAAQCLCAFILPAYLTGRFAVPGNPWKFLRADYPVSGKAVIGLLLLFFIAQPMMNLIIEWNQNISLPDALSGFEKSLRDMEDLGASTTEKILSDTSVGGLVINILIVGVLTGFSEELFFRGALQTTLRECGLGRTGSIWIAAIIFSTLHFQFFGFVPRLLMGAMFGYLFFWTRSIWTSVILHALNNSMVVLVYWLSLKGLLGDTDPDKIGLMTGGLQIYALASTIITALFLYYGRKILFSPEKEDYYGKKADGAGLP